MKNTFIILACALGISFGQAQKWNIDVSHSSVKFTVQHMMVAETEGNFKTFSSTITSTNNDMLTAQIEATIDVNSINTDNTDRDNHLKSPDFFDAGKFPTATFKSTKVSKTPEGKYEITGDLTMRGITKTVTLLASFNGMVKDPWGNTRCGWKATVDVNRFDYGLQWSKTMETGGLVVGETVSITIKGEYILAK